jgi:hypothetical protein
MTLRECFMVLHDRGYRLLAYVEWRRGGQEVTTMTTLSQRVIDDAANDSGTYELLGDAILRRYDDGSTGVEWLGACDHGYRPPGASATRVWLVPSPYDLDFCDYEPNDDDLEDEDEPPPPDEDDDRELPLPEGDAFEGACPLEESGSPPASRPTVWDRMMGVAPLHGEEGQP